MAYELSGPQKEAVELRGGNLLVAAGAGSGKTTVLVARILSLLLDTPGCDIDSLLVLTFTNAAAAEMRQRIEEALLERLAARPEDTRLSRQLALLQQAPITTIHSFCLDVVRRNFYRLGLDAGFRIPSETERAIMQEETLTAFLEAQYEQDEDGQLAELADCYGGRHDDSALSDLIANLYRYSRSQPHPAAWLQGAAAALGGGRTLDDYAWSAFLRRELQGELGLARRNLDAARELALYEDIPPEWLEAVTAEIAAINALLGQNLGLKTYLAGLGRLACESLPSIGKRGEAEAKKEFRRLRDAAKKELRALQKRYCRRSLQAIQADLEQAAPLMAKLCALVEGYAAALAAEKRARNLVDFDDMEHFCLALLEDETSGVAAELRASFTELLIDEYQDINAVQERMLSLLARGDNSFAVGDVKQSIYRFRLADPGLFLAKYHAYGAGDGGTRIDLNRNYRSEPSLIAGVNFLFRQLMSEEAAELDYDEAAELQAGREPRGGRPEFWLVETKPAADPARTAEADNADATGPAATATDAADSRAETLPEGEEHALAAEARLIGKRALELQAAGYSLGDMVILLRATKNRENVFCDTLAEMGIPALAAGKPGYLETPEISLMLALLAVIDNPLQEIELAALLRSPLFGFTLDELVQLRFAGPEELWQGLQHQAAEDNALGAKTRAFLTRLNGWRKSLRTHRISELIWAIYQDTGLYYLAGALPQGGQRQANLWRLYQKAREYEASSYRGLFRFLLYLNDSRGREAEQEGQPAEELAAIRIMSIHRSKGLEFPVVFLANLGGSFALMDERQDIVWHKELGLGPKIVDRHKRLKFPSLAHDAVARRLHQETMAEEMRVLYVALTRARDQLILTASVKDAAKTVQGWYAALAGQGTRLDGAALRRDGRMLDWLGKALLRHPDAGALRALADLPETEHTRQRFCLPEAGRWRIGVTDKSALQAPGRAARESLARLFTGEPLAPSPEQAEVERVLSYRYPYQTLCDYPGKWTVTELNRLQAPPSELRAEAAPLLPQLVEEAAAPSPQARRGLAANRRGSVHHTVLQHLDLRALTALADVAAQVRDMTAAGLLLPEEAAAVDAAKIWRFCASPLGRRLAASERCIREAGFTYALPAQTLLPEAPADEKLILQGMIDAAFWQDGAWVLLDYKTGGFGKSEAELRALYAAQLGYYRAALAAIWQAPVRESWLCFLDLGQNILISD